MRSSTAALIALVLFAIPAEAQFRQYTTPGGPGAGLEGGLSSTGGEGRREQLEEELERARWRLGPIRLAPWLGIREVSYIDNVFAGTERAAGGEGEISDLTATAGLGLTAYLPTGRKVFWTVEALPEYIWWRDLSARNQWVGRYGAGAFGFFNRLTVEARVGRDEQQAVVTPEFPQRTVSRQDRADLSLELTLSSAVRLFARGAVTELDHPRQEPDDPRLAPFERLDREERSIAAGVRYVHPSGWVVDLGAERTETDSDPTARNLSGEGTAPTLGLRRDGERLGLAVDLALRELTPVGGSELVAFERLSGDFEIRLSPSPRLELQLYGYQNPVLSLFEDYSHFDDRRLGLAAGLLLHRRLRLQLFFETGENRFVVSRPQAPERTDDVEAYGGNLSFELTPSLRLNVGAQTLCFDSPLPDLDRELSSVHTGLVLNPRHLLWR